jgi:mRNA-degrading endonuclease toxin of MazEF toxin-antitoxin module
VNIARSSKRAGAPSSSGRAMRNGVLQSVLVVPLTTNLERANLAGTAMIEASEFGPPQDSVALAFQMRAIPKRALETRIRVLTDVEVAELEMATDEALGRLDPEAP